MKKRILSAFLALCLVLTLTPLAALAVDDADGAMPEGTTGADGVTTITLEENVTLSKKWTVAKDSEVILNLNGHKLTTAANAPAADVTYTINVAGKLTIIDSSTGTSGEVNNGHPTASTIDVANDGKLILGDEENINNNNFIIENSVNKTSNKNSAIKVEEKGILIVNGGTVKGPKTPENNYRSIQTFGNTTINGGVFEGEVQVWTWAEGDHTFPSELTIEGGQFKDTVAICNPATASASFPFEGTLNIKGGTFTNENGNEGGYVIGIQAPSAPGAAQPTDAKAEVSGGTFDTPVAPKYLAENLKYQAKTEGGEYSYHVTQEEAEAAAGDNGTISAKTEGDEMEPVIKVKGAGFIWDIDDEAAQEAVRALGGTVGRDWIDQTMYVVLDQPLGNGKFAWISAEIGGETWGCACVGNNTSKTYAFSFLNLGQMEQKPEGASPEGLSGETAINAKISVYKTEDQLTDAPADLTLLTKIGEEPVTISKKPDNDNPNLKVENVATDVSTYAKVTVSGMLDEKVYAVRFAQSATQPTDMTIIILEDEETHDFYTQGGQKIWVFELDNKSDLVPGEDNKLHYTSLVEHTAAKVLS